MRFDENRTKDDGKEPYNRNNIEKRENSDLPEGEGERAEFKIVKRRENRIICCVPS